MTFCFITTFFPPQHFGGDAVFVANLANSLSMRGHKVEVVHCADSFRILSSGPPSPMELHPGVKVHTLESRLGSLSPLATYATGEPWLKDKLRSILNRNFDVVHWHNISLVGGPGALKYGSGVRLCTLHDYWWICPTHILFKNNEQACTKRECFRCLLAYRRLPQPWRWGSGVQKAIRDIDCFIAPSNFVQRLYSNSALGIQARVLPHFCPPQPSLLKDRSVQPYYLFVGRLEKAKGLQNIIPFFVNQGRRLKVAGTGTYETELRGLAHQNPNIEFLGRVPHSQLRFLYANARATIIPSICFETFGLTVLESFGQSTPVITSGFGALPEVVEKSGGGIAYRDLGTLEATLQLFDRDPQWAERLGRNGHRALEDYTADKHLARYFQIIEEVHERSGKSPTQLNKIQTSG